MPPTDRERIIWVDFARGMGIILVVLGHTLRGLHASGILADSRALRDVDAWIYSFHMPLFFLLSGLFAERRMDRSPGAFLRDLLATLGYPYLVWSVLQTLLQSATSRYTNHQASFQELVGILISPILQFWFLYVLFLIALGYYALRRCGLGPAGLLYAFTALWALQQWGPHIAWWPLVAAMRSGVYYALGAVVNRHGGPRRFHRAPANSLVMVTAVGFAIVTAGVLRPADGSPAIGLALALAGISATIALAILLSRMAGWDFLRVLGVYSLEIYVAHTIASGGLRILLRSGLKVQDPATHIVIGTLGGILLPLLLVWLCRRFNSEWLFRLPHRKPAS